MPLKQILKVAGLTQVAAADKLGILPRTLRRQINAKEVTLPTVERYADMAGVAITYHPGIGWVVSTPSPVG